MPRNGNVIGFTKIVDNGPDIGRFNIMILGDGFTGTQLDTFREKCSQAVAYLASIRPFSYRLKDAINVYRVDVTSTQSGAADPTACGGSGAAPLTYFDATYCSDGLIQRALTVNNSVVTEVCGQFVPGWHYALVLVNSTIWGGARSGNICTSSLSDGFEMTVVHELGHAVGGLGDEYTYYQSCSADGPNRTYTGPEPVYPNLTINQDGNTLKWRQWVLPTTQLPTMVNPDCSQCDTRDNPYPASTVGLYSGGNYKVCGVFRPQYGCIMRDSTEYESFCYVCFDTLNNVLRGYAPFVVHEWLATRRADGSWVNDEGIGPVNLPVAGVDDLASCTLNDNLFLFLISNSQLYWNERFSSGHWLSTNFAALDTSKIGPVTDVSAAAVEQQVFISVIAGGVLYTNVLSAAGVWGGFQTVPGSSALAPQCLASAAVGGSFLLLATSGNKIFQGVRYATGTWEAFQDLSLKIAGLGMPAEIACCGHDSLEVSLFVESANTVLGATRRSDGAWSSTYEDIGAVCRGLGGLTSLECASDGPVVYLTAATGLGVTYAMRVNGAWDSRTQPVGVLPATASRVTCDVIAGALFVYANQ